MLEWPAAGLDNGNPAKSGGVDWSACPLPCIVSIFMSPYLVTTSMKLTFFQACTTPTIEAGFDVTLSTLTEVEGSVVERLVRDLFCCLKLVLMSSYLVTMSSKLTSIASLARLAFDLGCGGVEHSRPQQSHQPVLR